MKKHNKTLRSQHNVTKANLRYVSSKQRKQKLAVNLASIVNNLFKAN